MKSLTKITCLSLLLMIITLVSCGGADYNTINQKIEEEREFTDKEYSAMLDYIENYIDKQLPKINDVYYFEDEQDLEEWDKDLDEAGQVFVYFATLSQGKDEGKLNSSNLKRLNSVTKKIEKISQTFGSRAD